ncbi:MAG: dihydroorotate dehydrogenase electron transfer subunit [candidate division FCPU426 bacterium]
MNCRVLRVRRAGSYARLWLEAPDIARRARPGQFVMVRPRGADAPFWRRPFSLCSADGRRSVELLIKAVGPGSRLLAASRPGDLLDVTGPLGTGFSLDVTGPVLLVGGGFGIAPLRFLAECLRRRRIPCEVFLGGRCREDLLLQSELKLAAAGVACTTEDGSFGRRGRVTLLLAERLAGSRKPARIAAAGPEAMLAVVADLAEKHGVAAEVSLETVMACGLGVCNGCVRRVNGQYQRVCADGPVFDAAAVDWSQA